MARVPYVEKSELSAKDQALLTKNYTAFKALANSPECLRVFWGLGGYFQDGGLLSPRIRELALLQIGILSGCAYEWSHHVKIALAVGISPGEIHAMRAGNAAADPNFSTLDLAVLTATTHMYAGLDAGEAVVAQLKELLGSPALVELVILIGLYAGMVRILTTLAIDVEPEYQVYLDEFALPPPSGGAQSLKGQ